MSVSQHQLQFDFDEALARLADQLDERRRIPRGAERLLEALVRVGLADDALPAAAALVLALDEPRERPRMTA
jgi:hypothetical protein